MTMELECLKNKLSAGEIPFSNNQSLLNKNTFKIDCSAKLFITPQNIQQLINALQICKDNSFFLLGGGSNIVLPENYDGIIISTEKLSKIELTSESQNSSKKKITCLCGTSISSLINFCIKNNLSGLEQFAGLPGSIGGACYMNARCFDKSISDVLISTEHLELSNNQEIRIFSKEYKPSEWDYKKSPFQNTEKKLIVTKATFSVEQKSEAEHQQIEADCKKYINERVSKGHFQYPSAGSVFKNNHSFGAPSGKLIDEAGLRGTQIGGAKIADFHGNFIINVNHATQSDIKALVELAKKTVKEKFGFLLEPEIIFVDK